MKNKDRTRNNKQTKIINPDGEEVDRCQVPNCRNEAIWEYQDDCSEETVFSGAYEDGTDLILKGGVITLWLCQEHHERLDKNWEPPMKIDRKHRDYHYNELILEGAGSHDYVVECPLCGHLMVRVPFANETKK
jgi:hypothetical protein